MNSSSCETTTFKNALRYKLEEPSSEEMHTVTGILTFPETKTENFYILKKQALTLQDSFVSQL